MEQAQPIGQAEGPLRPTGAATKPLRQSNLMQRGWANSGSPSDARSRALEREVFERVFGYRAVPGATVPRFTEDAEMTEAVIVHIREAWRPMEFRIWRRRDAAQL